MAVAHIHLKDNVLYQQHRCFLKKIPNNFMDTFFIQEYLNVKDAVAPGFSGRLQLKKFHLWIRSQLEL